MTTRLNAVAIIAAAIVSLTSITSVFALGGFRINLTRSYPLGLWRIEPLNRDVTIGDRVFICLPLGAAATLALERNYLPRGLCPSRSGPLIKTVVAVAGQQVAIDDEVIIDGKLLPSSRILHADAEGRSMPAFCGGKVGAGAVFLHSDFEGSYDSRYFGPIPTSGVLGLAREIITFSP